MHKEELGLGMVGNNMIGQHAGHYLIGLRKCSGIKLICVSDYPGITKELQHSGTNDFAKENNIPFYGEDYMKVIKDDNVDIVMVMSEISKAADITVAAANHGKHVIRDKPIALSMEDANRMVEAVKRNHVKALCTTGERCAEPLREAYRRVKSGIIDDLLTVNMYWFAGGGKTAQIKPAAAYLREMGNGEVSVFAPYALDYLLWLTGKKVLEVYAEVEAFWYKELKEVGMNDFAQINLKFEDGIVGTVVIIYSPCLGPRGGISADITGTKGTIEVHSMYGNRFEVHGDSSRYETGDIYYTSPLIHSFVQSIRKDKPSPVTFEDARNVLEIILAALQSAKEHRPIKLPLARD